MYYGERFCHRHMLACCVCAKARQESAAECIFFGGSNKKSKTTPCTVEGSLIDKGFSNRVAAASAAAIKLTRRAKHWQDAIVIEDLDSRLSWQKGHELVDDNGSAETAPPRVYAAKDLVGAPDDEPALHNDRQADAGPARGGPEPQQNARDDHDPQNEVRPLSNGDGTCFAAPEKPLKKSPHDHSAIRARPHPLRGLANRPRGWL